ncbi:hypothetical protein Cgig2_021523 [Carnegiea gigantea]|uniref:Uncharacterized protein n=1 Tax=Carnegiea gigantea TaxID=171969 RepID=A0A9Q1KEF5_9CARY|nr:hypothetical protein Cgig2_021523 [Carnegiea gigantea]
MRLRRSFGQGRADFKDLVNSLSCLSPPSGDLASPSTLTRALPTITPSAPHSATYIRRYAPSQAQQTIDSKRRGATNSPGTRVNIFSSLLMLLPGFRLLRGNVWDYQACKVIIKKRKTYLLAAYTANKKLVLPFPLQEQQTECKKRKEYMIRNTGSDVSYKRHLCHAYSSGKRMKSEFEIAGRFQDTQIQ